MGEDRLREAEAPPGTGAREAGRREGERQGRRPLSAKLEAATSPSGSHFSARQTASGCRGLGEGIVQESKTCWTCFVGTETETASETLVRRHSLSVDHVSLCTISLGPIPAVSLAGHRVFFAVVL